VRLETSGADPGGLQRRYRCTNATHGENRIPIGLQPLLLRYRCVRLPRINSNLGARMKKLLLVSVAGVALVAAGAVNSADAADIARKAPPYVAPPPPPPVFSWTGCFVGAHWGWGWGRKTVEERFIESEGFVSSAASGRIETDGAIFGGQVGCDYQFGWGKGKGVGGGGGWVIGVQFDAAGTDINGFTEDPLGGGFGVVRGKEDWLASVTGRLGWAGWERSLFYVRGGGAWTHDRWDLVNTVSFLGTDVISQNRSGWTVGVGAEWAFLPNWSAFVEWNHYDFGTKHRSFTGAFVGDEGGFGLETAEFDAKQRLETVKIGVNYRFNFGKAAPVVARY
jgi:outer membrane immunogenic protein